MIDSFRNDPVIKELASIAPKSRVVQINNIMQKNLTVADLVDDLDDVYAESNSKEAQEFRKQQRHNKLYIDNFIKQKKLV